jgi:predicted cation transporter
MVIGLLVILVFVLILPFTFHHVERNLEAFLFVMGLAAALVGGVMNVELILDALKHPVPITAAVLVMGLVFKWTRKAIERAVGWLATRIPIHILVFLLILVLGLFSSAITVIIASLVLVEVISILRLQRKSEVRIVILACFALGLGAALTPIGEPLSTIAVYKLSGEPYHAGFWFLLRLLGAWIIPGIVAFALLSFFLHERRAAPGEETLTEENAEARQDESFKDVFFRAFKVYLFVMALVFLGEGFKPLVDRYVLTLPALGLYWINTVSAVLDNATLTAAEISPKMDLSQVRDVLLGLLLSGGMLIPGNIPNIIAASKLKIRSKEWAVFALPLGFAAMLVYFFLLLVIPGDKPPVAGFMPAEDPASVTILAEDDRGIAVLQVLQGEAVLLDVDYSPSDPQRVKETFRRPAGATDLTVLAVDTTGHRVRLPLPAPAAPASARPAQPPSELRSP